MRAKSFCVLGTLVATAVLWSVRPAHGQEGLAKEHPEIFPLSKVRRGQKGYGLTTMQGTTPERFEFEVISVNRNFLPKMDIILVKSDDPKVQISGFWQGMSGSPLFIENKLTCAFSYGFRFNKLAIGGCTPIRYMQSEGFRKRRGITAEYLKSAKRKGNRSRVRAPKSAASLAEYLNVVPDRDIGRAMKRGGRASPWLTMEGLPKRQRPADTERGMTASAVPLALSGFSAPAFAEAKRLMKGFPVEPMQAGGTGSPGTGPRGFQLGGAIAVQLVRGDMSAAATGTVSYVDGDGVLAFGHPMFHAGELYAPVAAAEIHTVIPSAANAFVVASPLRELGSLTQDRQSTIAADTGIKVEMIPLHIRIRDTAGKSIGDFRVEVLDNRFFTGTFAAIAAMNATSLYLPDRDHVTLKTKSRVVLRGHAPLEFTDFLHSETGAAGAMASARGLRVLGPLLSNPFEPVDIEAIELDVQVAYGANFGKLASMRLPSAELVPGQRNYVDVELERYKGKRITRRLAFDVPSSLAGSIVRLEVTSGDSAPLYIAPPTDLGELVDAFRSLLPGTVYAVTLYSAQTGAAIDGKLIRDLPASALDRLSTRTHTPSLTTRTAQSRTTLPAKQVIKGSHSILVKVGDI